ncbi:hypothetical protein BX661DRAFT_180715 [Kickxella alabastrina]|uniref:uncharacterized protein n=1 Tax=Kickxella alabastrina TaxID=61397 RepID=UPI002220F178|nr:uncharacterized protein BX661DRAFT_180715 [Kickxella alabastrina]KAI7829907.1 hypothetical protein BX661DRAFT_180715 [Kickxella alabastrina]KAJ1933557.1 hypothetical protein GGF37_006684 [Kickxella alabastrina]
MKLFAVSAIALATFSSTAFSQADLVADAGTITNTQSFASAVKDQWVNVYYKVNQNIFDLKFANKPAEYFTATWLYGTDQLPASYNPTWAPGFLARAQALHEKTAGVSEDESSREEEGIDSEDSSESDGLDSVDDDDSSSASSSSSSSASAGRGYAGVMGAALTVAVAAAAAIM